MAAAGSSNHREIVVNDTGSLSKGDLGNYFGRFGYILHNDVRLKCSQKTTQDGRPFNFAFIRFQDSAGCTAALSSSVHVIRGHSCNVALCNAEKLRPNCDGNAAGINEEFKLFGNFMEFEGFRYLLNNAKFGSVGDYAVSVYMEQDDEIPATIGGDTNVMDALIAAEIQEAAILRYETSGDWSSAKLHRAVHVNLLAALDEYSHGIDITQKPAGERIMWVAGAPISTTYRHIRDKFHGDVYDVLFQRRGAPDFSSCSGYYVIFSSAEDARMGYVDDGYPAVAVDDDNWWHRTFWLFFVRRALAITAILNNVGMSSHSWRHSKYAGDRQYAIAKTFKALQTINLDEANEEAAMDSEDEGTVSCAESAPLVSRNLDNVERPPSPLACQQSSWEDQMVHFDLDPYFEDQHKYEAWREEVRHQEGKRRKKKNKTKSNNVVDTSKAALRRDLAFTMYQVYGNTKFFGRVGYPRQMQFPRLNECDRVTPGYLIEKCKKWLARNGSFRSEIVKFLKAADCVYPEASHHLLRTWSQDDSLLSGNDDGTLFGDAGDVLMPPADYRIALVEDAEGLRSVIDHLRELSKWDAIALDTEGHGNAYVGTLLDVMQIATTRKECFVIDVQKCHGLAQMSELGTTLSQSAALRFGQNFGNADAESFWKALNFNGNVPVHEINRMVLKVMGLDETTARNPSLVNVVKFALSKDLPKDATLSLWDKRIGGHLTARQQRYAASDVIAIILLLEKCRRSFPNRFSRYWDNFALLKYVPRFEYQNWNENAYDKLDLPVPLQDDDPSYTSRI